MSGTAIRSARPSTFQLGVQGGVLTGETLHGAHARVCRRKTSSPEPDSESGHPDAEQDEDDEEEQHVLPEPMSTVIPLDTGIWC